MPALKCFLDEQAIAGRVKVLAREIEHYIGEDDAVIIANLKGSILFFSDLIREIRCLNLSLDFIATESYQGSQSSGEVRITHDLSTHIAGKKVLLVEDILDTGLTLSAVNNYIKNIHRPSEMKVCVLLNKTAHRKVDLVADYIGFEIDDHFVVGYGLDYNQKYRNLPFIAVLDLKIED